MRFQDVIGTALGQIRANKLRSFFTLLGIIVSVTFLVAVVAIIQGMNAYVRENIAGAMIGANSFQVRAYADQLRALHGRRVAPGAAPPEDHGRAMPTRSGRRSPRQTP